MLRKFGIKPFREQNPDFDLETLSCFRAADYGGRVETLVTLRPVLSAHVDFCSQYPAVASLLGIQRFLVAEKVRPLIIDRLPEWMASLTTEKLLDRSMWPYLCGIALVKPNGDFLPFRSSEGFHVRTVENGEPYWVGLPDIVASILKTGRVPQVLKTILLFTDGSVQSGVRPAKFFGGSVLDPRKDDLFTESVYEKEWKTIPKQAVNALAYGLHGEINQERGPHNDGLTIYCAGRKFHRKSNRLYGDLAQEVRSIYDRFWGQSESEDKQSEAEDEQPEAEGEQPGGTHEESENPVKTGKAEGNRLYFPVEAMGEFYGPLATLVASGGRLLLQMLLDVSLAHELEHCYANTDCAILEHPNRDSHRTFYSRIKSIQSEFERLSPYSIKEVLERKPIYPTEPKYKLPSRKIDFLKLKPYNYTAKDHPRPTVYFSVGGTKYVEFSLGTEIATIRHISQGGSGAIQDPKNYDILRFADIDIDKDALEADCPRQILADAWQIATAMAIEWQRDRVFSKFEVTGEIFCTYLRKRLEAIENFHHNDDKGRSYIDRIIDYFDPTDPDDPDDVVASWRRFVIGKDGRHEGDIIHPLFEIEGESIIPISKPFCDEAHPENPFFQLYMAGLWFKFVEDAIIPQFWHASKADILSDARRIAIEGTFDGICGVDISSLKEDAAEFLEREMKNRALEGGKDRREFLDRISSKLGLDADRYGKIKRAVRRLKGSTAWFDKLDASDLQNIDRMMNEWRSSGLNYWAWQEEKEKERNAEAEKKRQEREARKQETPEERADRRRGDSAECMRRMRAAEAERKCLETLEPKILKPADVLGAHQDFCVQFVVLKPEQTKDDAERMSPAEKKQKDAERKRLARENETPEKAAERRRRDAERKRLARLSSQRPTPEQSKDESASPIDLGLRQ